MINQDQFLGHVPYHELDCTTEEHCQKTYEEQCLAFSQGLYTPQLTAYLSDNPFYLIFLTGSALCSLGMAKLIYSNPQIQAHPSWLIMCICLSEAILAFNQMMTLIVCKANFPQILNQFLFYSDDTSWKQLVFVQTFLFYCQYFTECFFLQIVGCFNYCLVLDFMMLIRTPFEHKDSLIYWYLIVSLIGSLAISILDTQRQYTHGHLKHWSTAMLKNFNARYLGFVVIVAFIFTFASYRLRGQSLSKNLFSNIFKRYTAIAIIYIFGYIQYTAAYYYYEAYPTIDRDPQYNWCIAFKLLYASSGYLMMAVRLTEPAVRQLIYKRLTCKFQRIELRNAIQYGLQQTVIESNNSDSTNERSQEALELAPVYSQVAQHLSRELVFVILNAITKFSYLQGNTQEELQNAQTNKKKIEKIAYQSNINQEGLMLIRQYIKVYEFQKWNLKPENLKLSLSLGFESKEISKTKPYTQSIKNDVGTDTSQQSQSTDFIKPKDDVNQAFIQDLEFNGEPNSQQNEFTRIKFPFAVTYYKIEIFKTMFSEFFDKHMNKFHQSLSPKFNRDQVFKAGKGSGKSGSFFFFSHDRKYIIKTISWSEKILYLNRLQNFCKYHTRKNKDSLLSRIFGIFKVETKALSTVLVILQENTMQLQNSQNLMHVFDLKGSIVNREVFGEIMPQTTLKDVNFMKLQAKMNRGAPSTKLLRTQSRSTNLSSSSKSRQMVDTLPRSILKKIRQSIVKDSMFLASQGIMDYSLLLAIEKVPVSQQIPNSSKDELSEQNSDSSFDDEKSEDVSMMNSQLLDSQLLANDEDDISQCLTSLDKISFDSRNSQRQTQRSSQIRFSQSQSKKRSEFSKRSLFEGNDPENRHMFTYGDKIYHISIIDYLVGWDCTKKSERCLKVSIGRDGPNMSAIEPMTYGKRFRHFMLNQVFN